MKTIKINKNIHKYSIGLLNDTIEIETFIGNKDIGVILVPPDPNWGGGKNTLIIQELFWYFISNQISVQRFSFTRYPIVNHNYDRYISQAALCVEEFIEIAKLPTNFFILGYSFGAAIALNILLRRPELTAGILIAPPVNYYNIASWISPYKTTIAMIYGDQDDITPTYIYNEYNEILKNNQMNVMKYLFTNTDHYFKNSIPNLKKTIWDFINIHSKQKRINK